MRTRFAVIAGLVATAVAVSGLALLMSSEAQPRGRADLRTLTADEEARLFRAEERLIRQCMSQHGFEYQETLWPADDDITERAFPYVMDDVAWAGRHGYLDVVDESPGDTSPFDIYFRGLSRHQQLEWEKTLLGEGRQLTVELPGVGRLSTSDNGCQAEARRRLYGDLARWYQARRTADNVPTYVRRAVREDPRFVAAVADWAACMVPHGYHVQDVGALREDLGRRTRGVRPAAARSAEIRTAVAEATCANTSSMSRVVASLERKHERQLNAKFRRELAELNKIELAALPTARKVLADPIPRPTGPSGE